jgi:hypothetical protein
MSIGMQKITIRYRARFEGKRKAKRDAKEVGDQLDRVAGAGGLTQQAQQDLNMALITGLDLISVAQLVRFSAKDINDIFVEGEDILGNSLSLATSLLLLTFRITNMMKYMVQLQAIAAALQGTLGLGLGIGALGLIGAYGLKQLRLYRQEMYHLNMEANKAIHFQRELSGELGRTTFTYSKQMQEQIGSNRASARKELEERANREKYFRTIG